MEGFFPAFKYFQSDKNPEHKTTTGFVMYLTENLLPREKKTSLI